jgi:hypothetical protein
MPLDKVIAGVSGPPVVSVLVAAKKPEVMLTGGEHGGEVVKWPLTVPLTFTLKDGCTYRLAKRKDGSQEYAERLESEVDFSDGGVQTVKHIVTPLATFTGKK